MFKDLEINSGLLVISLHAEHGFIVSVAAVCPSNSFSSI